jgi:hypothetical protein
LPEWLAGEHGRYGPDDKRFARVIVSQNGTRCFALFNRCCITQVNHDPYTAVSGTRPKSPKRFAKLETWIADLDRAVASDGLHCRIRLRGCRSGQSDVHGEGLTAPHYALLRGVEIEVFGERLKDVTLEYHSGYAAFAAFLTFAQRVFWAAAILARASGAHS